MTDTPYLKLTPAQRDEHRGPSRIPSYADIETLEPILLTDGNYIISSHCVGSPAYEDRWEVFAELPTMTQEQVAALIA